MSLSISSRSTHRRSAWRTFTSLNGAVSTRIVTGVMPADFDTKMLAPPLSTVLIEATESRFTQSACPLRSELTWLDSVA